MASPAMDVAEMRVLRQGIWDLKIVKRSAITFLLRGISTVKDKTRETYVEMYNRGTDESTR